MPSSLQNPDFAERIVYVLGISFSGATLLSFLLDSMVGVTSVGEMEELQAPDGDIGKYICSCGQPLAMCPFWTEVSLATSRRGVHFGPDDWRLRHAVSRRPLLNAAATRSLGRSDVDRIRDGVVARVPGWAGAMREISERNAAVVDSILEITGETLFADGSKDPRRVVLMQRYAGVRPAAIVHMVRDPLGFGASWKKNHGESTAAASAYLNRFTWRCVRLHDELPDVSWLTLRYEDLCSDPARSMQLVAQMLDLPPQAPPSCIQREGRHILGNRMRLSHRSDISLDKSWPDVLKPDEISQILADTRQYRSAFGYDCPSAQTAGVT